MTVPRGRPRPSTAADRPRPDGPAAPGERLAALLAEAGSGDAAPARTSSASPGPDAPEPGPAHRWEVATRTRVPVSLLLLAVAGLAVLAWSLLGPGGAEAPEAPGGPVLAEMGIDSGTDADGPAPSPAPVPAGPVPTAVDGAPASPGQRLAVHVTGEVARPGVVQVDAGARVVDAVEAAGGLTEHATTVAVNLAAPVADGQQVVVPDARAQPAPVPLHGGAGAPAAAAPPSGAGEPAGPVDLNTASAAELESLPKLGPVLAGRILAFREQQGGFAAVEELDAVPGIGPALMEALLPLVTV